VLATGAGGEEVGKESGKLGGVWAVLLKDDIRVEWPGSF